MQLQASLFHRIISMKRLLFIALSTLAVLAIGTDAAHAQQVQGNAVGPKLGFYLDGGKLMLGGIAEFPFTSRLNFEPGVEIIFGVSNANRFVFDGNIRYEFLLPGLTMRPFIMGGIGLQLETSTTPGASVAKPAFLFNLGGGASFN